MTRLRIALALPAVGLFGVTLSLGLQAAGKPPADTPVTATIADEGSGYLLRVESDLHGSYVSTSQVTSLILGSTGDWVLTTYYKNKGNPYAASNRSVFVDLTEPVAANPLPPFNVAYVQASFMTACSKVGLRLPQIAANTTVQCPGHLRFQGTNGLWYRLSFNNDNFPAVDPLNVTCNAADAGGCRNWTVRPSATTLTGADPNPKNVAKLLQIDPGTTESIADLGNYYVSFSFAIAR